MWKTTPTSKHLYVLNNEAPIVQLTKSAVILGELLTEDNVDLVISPTCFTSTLTQGFIYIFISI